MYLTGKAPSDIGEVEAITCAGVLTHCLRRCIDPLISCSGVMFPKEIAHEYRDGRRDQALASNGRRSCDLVARITTNGTSISALLQSDGNWTLRRGEVRNDAQLRGLASVTSPLTFTYVPPGTGRRVALDQA
jgi:hypothetical protein